MEHKQYSAFISYRHMTPDQEIAKRLHTLIETYGIPGSVRKKTGKKKMGYVFRDQEELPLSSDLGRDIETALDRSEWFIAICSPRYLQSRWCLREMEYFIERKGRDHILTLLVEGEPADAFPEMIRFTTDENGNKTELEPLAADVRGKTLSDCFRKLKEEKLRILAPMLGLTFDDLKRRARKRKIRIAAAVAAVSLAAAAGMITYSAINHNRQEKLRQEAAEQQQVAEEERKRAEEEQRKAEEERKRAEEEQRRAEEERLNALNNSIGESVQKAISLRENGDRQQSAALLLDALKISEDNDNLRRDEIIYQTQKTMYIEPFTVISKPNIQNMRIVSAQVSSDGTTAVAISNGDSAAIIDLTEEKVLYTVSKGKAIDYVLFSQDGSRFLAIYGYYQFVTVWNTADGSEVYSYESKTGEGYLANVRFFHGPDDLLMQDGPSFYTVSLPEGQEKQFYTIGEQQDGYDYDRNVYTLGRGVPLNQIITDVADVYANMPMEVTPDGSKILIAGLDGKTGTILLDDQGQRISLLDQMPGTLVDFYDISPDGSLASCQSLLGFTCVWETETGRMRYMKSMNRSLSSIITAPRFSPDSQKTACMSNGTLIVAEARNGKELFHIDMKWSEELQVQPHLDWSPDGKYLIIDNMNLYIIDAESGEIALEQDGIENGSAFNNAVPAGNDRVFVTRSGGEAACYSLPGISSMGFGENYTGNLVGWSPDNASEAWEQAPKGEHQLTDSFRVLSGLSDFDPVLHYSREGEYAALTYPDGTIEVFRKGEEKPFLVNAHFAAAPLAFGICGDVMVASENTGRMMFQNLQNGELKILDGEPYLTLIFDGNLLLASRYEAKEIDVYDYKKGELLFTMRSSEPFRNGGFSADGKYAVFYTDNRCMTAVLWRDEEDLLKQAMKLAPNH